ncbi:MAG: formate dehydrogenase accessory sulfurtransferase FdhD, partial [Candidatus Zixiibacteriota bacterium]
RKDEVKKIVFDAIKDQVKIFTQKKHKLPKYFLQDETFTSGCGKRKSFQKIEDLNFLEDVLINLEFTISANEIIKLMKEFEVKSSVFKSTGGTHSAALADKEKILLFKEDIGRHNAVDKILGESLIENIPWQDKLLISSGRVSSDILLKAGRAKINLIISRSAPTSLALELAQRLGITVIGFARGKRMNIYTYPMRVVT